MNKLLFIVLIAACAGAYAGYCYGTKHPTVGDCVNSVLRGDN